MALIFFIRMLATFAFTAGTQYGCIHGIQCATTHGFEYFAGMTIDAGGDNQDGAFEFGTDGTRCLNAVHLRHNQVHEDNVRADFAAFLQRFPPS